MKNTGKVKAFIAKTLFAIMLLTGMTPVYAAEVTGTEIVAEDDSTDATGTDAVTEVAPLEEDGGIISEGGFLEEASEHVDSDTYNHAHDIELVRAMTNRETYINVKGFGITTSNYSAIMKGIINTNPQLFYVDYNNIRYTYIGSDVIKLTFAYFYSESMIQTMQSQISDAVSKIDSEVDTAGMNDLEIALAYHDYLATHIVYDSDGLASGSAPKTDYNIYGAFVNGKAVCQGYAEAMQYLLMRKDIICGIATSKNANHAWNVILYNGRWYHIDATWDDPTRDNLGRVNHDFFMITDTTLLADDAKKSDYVVIVPYGYTYKKAVDTTYEKGFWSGLSTQLYPYKGNWYFLEPVEVGTSSLGKTIYGFQIVKYNYALKSKTVLVEPTKAIWYTGSSTFYVSNHSRVAAKNGLLYFSMPKSVMCYNIETGKTDYIVALSSDFEKNENIYGLGFIKDSLCVVIKTSAPSQYDTTNETYYKVSNVGTRPIEVNPINDLPNVTVRYTTHVQTYGWQGVENNPDTWFKNGQMAGTSGKAKRLEGIRIRVDGNSNLGIQYMTHCQSYGWLPWSANGEMNGTEGEAKRLEAIRIALTGTDKDNYDVYYRVHAQTYGWLGWAKNGEPAGSSGLAKRLEGIQVVVVKKGTPAPGFNYGGIDASFAPYTHNAYMYKSGTIPTRTAPGGTTPNVSYRTHVQSYGWQGWKYNGQMSGTSGKAKRLEGINIRLTNQQYSGNIVYTTHVQTYGWQGNINNPDTWKKNGEMSGTSGQAKRLEAIKIALTGEMEQHYDIYYRVHAQSYGWLGWAKNGESAGTQGGAKRLEGIQIVLVEKGGKAPANNYGGIVSNSTRTFVTVVGN